MKLSLVIIFGQFGQVGVGDYTDRCSPVQVSFPNDQANPYPYVLFIIVDLLLPTNGVSNRYQKVMQICCGWRHTLAITERNNVFSWGRGTNGQLGHGDSVDR